jgi:hypothetical protein
MAERKVIMHSPSERRLDYCLSEYSLLMRDLACRLEDLRVRGGFRATAESLKRLERLLEPVREAQDLVDREMLKAKMGLTRPDQQTGLVVHSEHGTRGSYERREFATRVKL